MTTNKGLCEIKNLVVVLNEDLRRCLLIAHAMSRCDQLSATSGMGKLRVFNKLKESFYWRDKLQRMLHDGTSIEEVVQLGKDFFIQLYGNVAKNAKSLDQVREIIMYNLPKYVPIKRMPPTSRAFHFHMLCIYLQVSTWRHLKLTLDIEKFGFYKNADGYFAPTISDRDYAPEYLLKEVKCKCQNQTKKACYVHNALV